MVRAAEEKRISLSPISGFRAIPGKGAEAQIEGKNVKVVSPGFLKEQSLTVDDGREEKTGRVEPSLEPDLWEL